MKHICPNNILIFQSVTKPQQTNEHMREVINQLTHIHLLNTIKSILSRLQNSSVHPYDEDQEDARSKNPTVHIHCNFFKRKRWTRARISSLITICLSRVCSMHVQIANIFTALKNNPFICLGLGEKKAQRHIHGFQENHIRILNFLNLDR